MSRKVLGGLVQRISRSSTGLGGARSVARIFVPTYRSSGSICLRPRGNARALARRRLARLIEARRLSS
jgi:hypothetical protein